MAELKVTKNLVSWTIMGLTLFERLFKRKPDLKGISPSKLTYDEIKALLGRRGANGSEIEYDIEDAMRKRESAISRTWPVRYDKEYGHLYLEQLFAGAYRGAEANLPYSNCKSPPDWVDKREQEYQNTMNMHKENFCMPDKLIQVNTLPLGEYRTAFWELHKDAMDSTTINMTAHTTHVNIGLSTNIGKWYAVARKINQKLGDLKAEFIDRGMAGSINIDSSAYRRKRGGDSSSEAVEDEFKEVTERAISGGWQNDNNLKDAMVVTVYDYTNKAGAVGNSMLSTLLVYTWEDITDKFPASIYTEGNQREQRRAVLFVTVKNVPLWLVDDLAEGEDTTLKLRTTKASWERSVYADMQRHTLIKIKSDDQSWKHVQHGVVVNSGVDRSMSNAKGEPHTCYSNSTGCWVDALQLQGCLNRVDRQYETRQTALKATYPQMLLMLIASRGRAVKDTPVCLTMRDEEMRGLPIVGANGNEIPTIGVGHLETNNEIRTNKQNTYVVMRWNPEAVSTAYCSLRDKAGEIKGKHEVAHNFRHYLWS